MYPLITLNPTHTLSQTAPSFRLSDHTHEARSLDDLIGEAGVLLAFVGDIWLPETVQRVLALQRYAVRLAKMGCPVVTVINARASVLANFMLSSPLPVPFPLLADPEGIVHRAYQASDAPILVLVDRNRMPRYKWTLGGVQLLPPVEPLITAAQMLAERMHPRGL